MKRYVRLTLVVAVVTLLGVHEAAARGPQGRGGPGPGNRGPAVGNHAGPVLGHPTPGLHQPGTLVNPQAQQIRSLQNPALGGNPTVRQNPNPWRQNLAVPHGQWQPQTTQVRGNLRGRYNHLFTPQWYAQHPNAWHMTHPHADAWAAVAAWPVLAGWVGVSGSYPQEYGTVYENNTYYITDDGVPVAEGTDESVTEYPEDANDSTSEETTQGANATENANDWLPLGVYAVVPPNANTTPDRVFQFAVNKNGVIRGAYYDAVSDQTSPIQGAVNKQTRRAAWTVGSNRQKVMETNLTSFVEEQAGVTVHQGNGKTEQWTMVRLENPTTGPSGSQDTNPQNEDLTNQNQNSTPQNQSTSSESN
ncbi:MAG TPA: hypothetical protein VJL29_01045 [Thermoguttaceae bacterium]|nr:hypothetical protein [Thermoguttaceae bacterium]